MEAAHATWRPLGELIVERGLITEEQLEDALLEQRITRKRLGTILVDRGFVTTEKLTDALVDQVGVEELLDEFDGSGDDPAARSESRFASPFRRLRGRRQTGDNPSPRRLTPAFIRLGRGRRGEDAPVAPFAPAEVVADDEAEPGIDAPVVGLFGVAPAEAAAPDVQPAEERGAEADEPEFDVEPDELKPVAAGDSSEAADPHAWLDRARRALDEARADLAQLDEAAIGRLEELEEVRARLAGTEKELAAMSGAHRLAEAEIGRLHGAVDDRDATLAALERTVEDLREREARAEAALSGLRREVERKSGELARARETVSEHEARVAELQATVKDYEVRGSRIAELEALVTELAENLSATDETLGVEISAREQAQRESKRLREQLDEHEGRVTRLSRQVEALEGELEVVVAEREQAQRKLGSRERRIEKLESTLAELRAAAVEAAAAPVGPDLEQPGQQAGATADAEAQAAAEPETIPQASPEPRLEPATGTGPSAPAPEAEAPEGFLCFVPRAGEGFELVEHDGHAPAVGDRIELEQAVFEVTRQGSSPLPRDRRVCIYLRPAG
jgi:predicted  nucleic acid-binding Zn-ribbon protein